MPQGPASFAANEPGFWAQEDKHQDQDTKDIPLPRIPGVRPQKRLLNNIEKLIHRLRPFKSNSQTTYRYSQRWILIACRTYVNVDYIWTETAGSTICPSRICTIRRHIAAASGLWVIMTMV